MDWFGALDFKQALANLHYEFHGDWHRDPWGWPELEYVLSGGKDVLTDFLNGSGAGEVSLLDVPKENWGTRPAVVMDPVARIAYQALVDQLSLDIVGKLTPNAFGWRLPVTTPKRGRYSHNSKQWDLYRDHLSMLSGIYPVALKSDIVSFFASIPLPTVQEELDGRIPSNHLSKRLFAILDGFGSTAHRSGLPQRSTASAVIANMIMISIDDVLEHWASPLLMVSRSRVQYHSFARWMDDLWLFGYEVGSARRAQVELQGAAQLLGLNLNAAKTELLEGDAVVKEAREIEHSAVDDALASENDHEPLEKLVDKILSAPDKANRTSIKFAALRMIEHNSRYRAQELVQLAKQMPHAADSLAGLFKLVFTSASLQEWFLDYARSDWAVFEWTVAQYGRMFSSSSTSTFAVMRRRGPRLAGLPGFLRLLLVGGMSGEIGLR